MSLDKKRLDSQRVGGHTDTSIGRPGIQQTEGGQRQKKRLKVIVCEGRLQGKRIGPLSIG